MTDALPAAFDAATYRSHNPDLAHLSDAEARAHYDAEGRAGGRVAASLARREGMLALLADGREVLEIGPFCRPLLRGANVEYLDMLDADQLRARAAALGMDPAGCPERIHYVGDLAQVDRAFDAVVSSHAIEHQPDLIRHLHEIERILEPDGGFFLIVPDKRYCFDHFLPESSIAQVLQAHRDGRTRHQLASIVEHMALTTHNDSGRHWQGDHGDPARGRVERVRAAIDRHADAGTGYVDVHAWQFTPASFRATIDALAALGLTGLEAGEVYDTVHGRNEFCAVLRLNAAARAAKRAAATGVELVVLQTADPIRYAPMLAVTQANVAEYCRRHGFAYEAFVGIARGFHPWQACFNRILLLRALIERGFRGWALYLDCDAYVVDLDFDLASYLAGHANRGAILARSGVSTLPWDVNNGVMLVNLGHPEGRRLVEAWAGLFAEVDDATLRAAPEWIDGGNDQDMLHRLLRDDPALLQAVLIESPDLINSPHARFIRQHVRALTPDLDARVRAIAAEVAEIGLPEGSMTPSAALDRRWAARLAHPAGREPRLIEAPVPAPLPYAGAERIIHAWQAARAAGDAPVPPLQARFAELLDAGDAPAVAAMLAGMGREQLSQGFLGGARQHVRAAQPMFAARLALWTHDRLVSLAEAVGALDPENPEGGPWGINGQQDPAMLFDSVAQAIGVELAPPAHIGGYLGIAVGDGRVIHMRMLDAIHAAWRLRQLAQSHRIDRPRVLEIGGGAGFGALYAVRLGIGSYTLVDRPVMGAIQAAVLDGCPGLRLAGEAMTAAGVTVTTPESLGPARADILFNQDSLPEMEEEMAIGLLRRARDGGARLFLSINPDGRESPGGQVQRPVRELVAAAGGWIAAGRHRHWLRAGHVEELWVAG